MPKRVTERDKRKKATPCGTDRLFDHLIRPQPQRLSDRQIVAKVATCAGRHPSPS